MNHSKDLQIIRNLKFWLKKKQFSELIFLFWKLNSGDNIMF